MPRLTLAEADLGTTLVGFESDEWYVAVINTGTSSFVPATVTVSDPRFSINPDGSTCSLGVAVPPGGDCTVKLSFTPAGPGPVSANLTVAEDGFQAALATSTVRGTGGEPTLRIDPAGADLGDVVVGSSGNEFVFDVENISVVPTSIDAVVVEGANWADFVIGSNSCAGRPLNPRATCSVGVMFTPGGRPADRCDSCEHTVGSVHDRGGGDAHFTPTLEVVQASVRAGDDVPCSVIRSQPAPRWRCSATEQGRPRSARPASTANSRWSSTWPRTTGVDRTLSSPWRSIRTRRSGVAVEPAPLGSLACTTESLLPGTDQARTP